jgi:hypothetical protein
MEAIAVCDLANDGITKECIIGKDNSIFSITNGYGLDEFSSR